MKTKSSIRRNRPAKSHQTLEYFDALNRHCRTARTLAGLLELCEETNRRAIIDQGIISHAGSLILQELARIRDLLQRLHQEISR